jgi:hypothetical protein
MMRICPYCQSELPAEAQRCPQCDREISPGEIKMVPLHPLPSKLYAEMVKEVLEKRGIHCVIKTDLLSSAFGSDGSSAVGTQATIYVPQDRREESEEILHQMLDHI